MTEKIILMLRKTGHKILVLYTTALCKYFIIFAFVTSWIAFITGSGLKLHQQQRQIDMEYLYVPMRAQAKYELATIEEHWPITGDQFVLGRSFNFRRANQILVRRKDGSSMMNLDSITPLVEWNKWAITYLYGEDAQKKRYYFRDLCLTWFHQCSFTNQHLKTLEIMLQPDVTSSDVTYPKWKIYGFLPLYMGTILGGVELSNETDQVESFTDVLLIYYTNYLDPKLNLPRLAWEKRLTEAVETTFVQNESSPFDVSYMHSNSFDYGFTEVPALAASRLVMTINTLIAFSIINCCRLCLRSGRIMIDLKGSKPILGMAGTVTSVYGVITALGVYHYFGGCSVGIFGVIPFLTLAIGLDDTFIIIASWHRTDHGLPVSVRLSKSITDSLHSITITSITSCLSFVVGMLSKLPAVKFFCQATAMAIFFNYIYQITFFPALLYVSGMVEVYGFKYPLYFSDLPYRRSPGKHQSRGTERHPTTKPTDKVEDPFVVLIAKYCSAVLQHTVAKILTMVLYVIYLAPAFYGITQLKHGLQVNRLVQEDNHFASFIEAYWRGFYGRGQQVEIAINNAPNITQASERQRLEAMVRSVEDTKYTMGAEATQFFLRDYENHLRVLDLKTDDVPKVWQRGLYSWSTMNAYRRAEYPDMLWEKVDPEEALACRGCDRILKAFRFRIGLLGFNSTTKQIATAKFIRSLSDRYPEYNVTSYHAEWPIVDQYNIIVPNTLVSLSTAAACMAIVATVFFRDIFCIIWTVLSIVSINIGVIGYMSFWGVHLECVSMVCIIMSIGLSVDYTAHVVHGFRVATGSINERILESLTSLGIPVIQGGISTLLGVLALGSVHAYLLQVFFKVTTLAVCFGLLHACAFIPVALSSSAHLIDRFCHRGVMATTKSSTTHQKY